MLVAFLFEIIYSYYIDYFVRFIGCVAAWRLLSFGGLLCRKMKLKALGLLRNRRLLDRSSGKFLPASSYNNVVSLRSGVFSNMAKLLVGFWLFNRQDKTSSP